MVEEAMEYRILGPLEVLSDRGLLPLGPPKQRALLAALLLHPNEVVSADRLIDALWGGHPPPAAAVTLQAYVSGLRKVLEAGRSRGEVIETRRPGYLLHAAPGSIDAQRFEALLADGRSALQADPCRASELLSEALAQWRGEALTDVRYEDFAAAEAQRLEELRLTALEERVEADLACGRHGEVIGELRSLVCAHPLRERLWGQLMVALYRQGRQAEALDAYREARDALGEVGLEPGLDLRRLQKRILLDDPALAPPPPARPASHNLPPPLTSFVGRDDELREVDELLDRSRLVTLTGPGGVGKTRLALEAAARRVEAHADGVWMVELGALSDPGLVAQAVGDVLGVGLGSDAGQPGESLGRALARRQLLLVLDNCEHLASACAQLVERLLRAAPDLTILATSRQPLHAEGERTYPVAPLDAPAPDSGLTLERLITYDAIRLFTERASAIDPGFAFTADNADAVTEICHCLDGIPLALELAAARLRILTPKEIARGLPGRFQLLSADPGRRLPRHRRLRATMDWSHQLLSEDERVLFRRLAVFPGSFDLAAARAVADEDLTGELLDALQGLVEKSLVAVFQHDAGTRYRMLETVRAYASEQLEKSREEDRIRRRHRDHFLELAERLQPALFGPEQGRWLLRLDEEHDNLRTALASSLPHDVESGFRLAMALWRYWMQRGHWQEGRDWYQRFLAHLPDGSPQRLAGLLLAGGLPGDPDRQRALLEEGLRSARQLGDERAVARALIDLGVLARRREDADRLHQLATESLGLCRRLGEPSMLIPCLLNLAVAEAFRGDDGAAMARFDEALRLVESGDDVETLACSLVLAGSAHRAFGRHGEAASHADRALELYRELGNRWTIAWALGLLGDSLLELGELEAARTHLQEAIEWERESEWQGGLPFLLGSLAKLSRQEGDPETAAVLLGADNEYENVDAVQPLYDHPDLNDLSRALCEELGEARFDELCHLGRQLSVEELLRFLRAEQRGSVVSARRSRL